MKSVQNLSIRMVTLVVLIASFMSDQLSAAPSCVSLFSYYEINHQHTDSSIGLISELAAANTLILGYQDGVFRSTYVDLLRQLSSNTRVILAVVDNFRSHEVLEEFLSLNKNITLVDMERNQGNVWTRDWVPQMVKRHDGTKELVSLTYYAKDNSHLAAEQLATKLNIPHYKSWVIGELGNILTDGKGRLFVTQKIIDDNVSSNKKITKNMVLEELRRAFSVEDVVILPKHPADGGIGHVDLITKYVGSVNGRDTFLVSDSDNPTVKAALDVVEAKLVKLGYHVVRIQEYEKKIGKGAAGFVNSLILNNTVYMPVYSKAKADYKDISLEKLTQLENNARKIYESLGFKVVEVDAFAPIRGMGAVHCLTSTMCL